MEINWDEVLVQTQEQKETEGIDLMEEIGVISLMYLLNNLINSRGIYPEENN